MQYYVAVTSARGFRRKLHSIPLEELCQAAQFPQIIIVFYAARGFHNLAAFFRLIICPPGARFHSASFKNLLRYTELSLSERSLKELEEIENLMEGSGMEQTKTVLVTNYQQLHPRGIAFQANIDLDGLE